MSHLSAFIVFSIVLDSLQEQMTNAYTLVMQLHGYANKAVCILLAVF